MKCEVTYYPTAKWATVQGAFTASELREIADKIDNPEKRVEKVEEK